MNKINLTEIQSFNENVDQDQEQISSNKSNKNGEILLESAKNVLDLAIDLLQLWAHWVIARHSRFLFLKSFTKRRIFFFTITYRSDEKEGIGTGARVARIRNS